MHFNFKMIADDNAQKMWVRCADSEVAKEAKTWFECEVPLEFLKPQSADVPLGGYPHAAFHIAALRYIREVTSGEIQRLSRLQAMSDLA